MNTLTPRENSVTKKTRKTDPFSAKLKKFRNVIILTHFTLGMHRKLEELDQIKEQEIANYKMLSKEIENSVKLCRL